MTYLTERLTSAQKKLKAWLVRDFKQGWALACHAFRAVFRYKLVATVTGPAARIGAFATDDNPRAVVRSYEGLNQPFYKGWSCWGRVPERFRRHAVARARRLYSAADLKFEIKVYGPGGTVETTGLFS